MSWPWSQLGLPGPSDLSQIRHAYAEKLKTTHPEDDPEGFQRLHAAYQLASRMARQQKRPKRSFPQAEDTPPSRSRYAMREDDIMEIEAPEEDPPQKEQDFDFDELLQGDGERPRRSQEREEEERDFDFDELLQGDGERPRRSREREEEEQDFDFDELLQGDGERPRRSREREEEEQDFDFDELLQGDGERPRRSREREEEERDFDFERLFAEGEAERAEARRRRAEERRKAQERERQERTRRERERRNAYEQERQERFDQEQARWQNTETILHTIEMLYSSSAGEESWRKFFQSPLFQQNKGSLDLIFGLEDFVSAHSGLSKGVSLALFLAYGFDKGLARPELRTLYQMLLPVWKAEEKKWRKERRQTFLAVPVTLIFLLLGGAVLVSRWFLGYVVLGAAALYGLNKGWFRRDPENPESKRRVGTVLLWLLAVGLFTLICLEMELSLMYPLYLLALGGCIWVVKEVLRLGRQERKARGMMQNKRDERWLVAITAVCLIMGTSMLFMPELRKGLSMLSLAEDPREQVCHYLELDYGIPFQSIYNKTERELHANVFAPEGDVEKMFLAGPDGKRVVREGRLGYTTNYPDMMVLWALRDFAEDHGLRELETMNRNQGLESWDTCGVYLIVLPFYGAGEVITDLGETLEELAQQDWYQFQTPSFKVVLCSDQMAEGRLILQEYQSNEGDFDAEGLRTLYEEAFAQSCCAQIIKECQLDRDFTRGDAGEVYTLVNGGMAELMGMTCCKLYGVDGNGQVSMEYYIDVNSDRVSNIYCVPGGFWESGGEEDQMSFYRLIHREDELGLIYLYYPWLQVVS